MIRINNVKIRDNLEEKEILNIALKRENIDIAEVEYYEIYKKSIDARKKDYIFYNYAINVCLKDKSKEKKYNIIENEVNNIKNNTNKNIGNVIIIGSGPAGLFSAITLIENGVKPIIIERGSKVEDRVQDVNNFINNRELNEESNIQFGEGGAGTFSDGKLNTGGNNEYIRQVLKIFVRFGAPKQIMYDAKPHIGTDILVDVVKNIRNYIIEKGGIFLFNEKVIDFVIKNNKIDEIITSKGTGIKSKNVILAIGNSARDTFKLLYDKQIELKAKPFSVGVRIEHLQKDINFAQYGDKNKFTLPAAEYKLVKHLSNNRTCYSFCMCPGGIVVPATSKKNMLVVNGMSKFKRNEINSNSAIVVNVTPEDYDGSNPLNGIKFQEELEKKAYILGGENYDAPVQRVEDFLNNKITTKIGKVTPSYLPGVKLSNLNEILPKFISDSIKEALIEMNKTIKGFSDSDAILTAIETRTSCPLQIIRDKTSLMSNIKGIYPCGEGAGYAGGIMTSAIDGIKCAIKILE